jgi:hypothetical protein
MTLANSTDMPTSKSLFTGRVTSTPPRIHGTSSEIAELLLSSTVSATSSRETLVPIDSSSFLFIFALVDCLVNNIWTFGSYAVGALCSAFAFIYLKVLDPSFIQANSNLKAVVMLYSFITGFSICHALGYGAISSGVSTIFVGLAENPEVLAERDPALFGLIQQAYPQVVTSV